MKEVPRIVDYPGDFKYDEKLLSEIEAGKNSLNRDPAWISSARKELMIKSLDEVSESDFARYREYLDNGTLYIIVHPAYSIFFMNWMPNKTAEDTVDAFLSMRQPSMTSSDHQTAKRLWWRFPLGNDTDLDKAQAQWRSHEEQAAPG